MGGRADRCRRGAGGIDFLGFILDNDELHGCLENDLWVYCNQTDLRDFYRGKLSVRRLITFLRFLPSESSLAARGYAGDNRWSNTDHLAAIVADYLHVLDYHFLKANGAKEVKKPEMLPRPDMTLRN